VFSSPILVDTAKATIFVGCEFGGAIVNNTANFIISASYAFSATVISGSGTKTLSGNISIT
jgi:hypothetical protein